MTATVSDPSVAERLERIERITVTAHSPDRSIGVELSTRHGYRVEAGHRGLGHHTDDSLAAHATAAVRGATAGYGAAINTLLLRGKGIPDTERPADPTDPAAVAIDRVISGTTVTVTSPLGLVTARWTGYRDITLSVRPGTVRRCPDPQLVTELGSAITAVAGAYRRRLKEIHTSVRSATVAGGRS